MSTKSGTKNFTQTWKLMGLEFSVRAVLVAITFIAVLYMVASNWQWYVNDLGNTVKHPKWASTTANCILWVLWFIISVFVWHRHQVKHKALVKMDLVYPALLVSVFIMFTLFFEQRDLGAAKWFGVFSIVVMTYLIYEGFVTDALVSTLLTVELAILLYTVAQIWHASRNEHSPKNNWSATGANSMCPTNMCPTELGTVPLMNGW
jgi:hypothetical protein